jgi:flagellar motor component MotA
MVTTSLSTVTSLPKLVMKVFVSEKADFKGSIDLLVSMAERARRDGLLAWKRKPRTLRTSSYKAA